MNLSTQCTKIEQAINMLRKEKLYQPNSLKKAEIESKVPEIAQIFNLSEKAILRIL